MKFLRKNQKHSFGAPADLQTELQLAYMLCRIWGGIFVEKRTAIPPFSHFSHVRFQHVLHPEHPKQWFSSVKKASETLYIYAKNRALCFRGPKTAFSGCLGSLSCACPCWDMGTPPKTVFSGVSGTLHIVVRK